MGATAVATPVVRMIPARSFVVSTTARNNGKDTTSTTNNGDKEVRDEKDDGDKEVRDEKDDGDKNLDAAELLQQHYQQEREKEDLKRLQAYNKFGVFSWKGFFLNAIAFTLIGGAILYYASKKKEEQQLHAVKKIETIGKPSLGGPFSLINTEGVPMTDEDFRGRWMFIYFGFTNCPDICPSELDKMTKIVQDVDKVVPNVLQPIFISVDPFRDTPASIKAYLKDFHPRFIGLTGSIEQTKQVCRKFRVYFSEPTQRQLEDKDYIVDHSIIMYLMDPNGQFVQFFGKNFTAEEVSKQVLDYMKAFAEQQQQQQRQLQGSDK